MGMEHHVADLIQLLAPPKMNYSCVVRGPHRSSLPAQLSGVAQDPGEQRRSQEAGGPGLEVLSPEPVKRQPYLWNVQDWNRPISRQPFTTHVSQLFSVQGPWTEFYRKL